jgi:hypothetical protein
MVGEERKLQENRKRQRRWLDQVLAGEGRLKAVTEGRMLCARGRGRKRKGFLDGIKKEGRMDGMKREIGL